MKLFLYLLLLERLYHIPFAWERNWFNQEQREIELKSLIEIHDPMFTLSNFHCVLSPMEIVVFLLYLTALFWLVFYGMAVVWCKFSFYHLKPRMLLVFNSSFHLYQFKHFMEYSSSLYCQDLRAFYNLTVVDAISGQTSRKFLSLSTP